MFYDCYCSEFASKMESRAGGTTPSSSSRKPFNRSLSNSDVAGYEKNDGSVSDSALSSSVTENRKSRRPSLGYKVAALVGLSKKSSSTSQLPGQGGSEDAQDQSEAQYLSPEGHVTANMGASHEMSSFDSAGGGGSFETGGGSFDTEPGSFTEQRSFDRVGRSLDRGSGSIDRGSRSLDGREGSVDRPGRSMGRGNSVESRTRSVDRAGCFERANGSRIRREGRQMPAGQNGTRSGMAALRQNSADSVTSGYGSCMSRSTGATSYSTRSSIHGKDGKGLGKENMHDQQDVPAKTYSQESGQEYGSSSRRVHEVREHSYGANNQGYDATACTQTSQSYSTTAQAYDTTGYGGDTQGYNVTSQGYGKTRYGENTQSYTGSGMAAFSSYGGSTQSYDTVDGYGETNQGFGTCAQSYDTSAQAYNTTGQGYDTTSQSYSATSQGYGTTSQGNDTTSQGHSTGSQAYSTTSQGYDTSAQAYGTPYDSTASYGTNTQAYGTASQDYNIAQSYGNQGYGIGGTSQQNYSQNQISSSANTAMNQFRQSAGTNTTSTTGTRMMAVGISSSASRLGATSPSGIGKPSIPLASKTSTDQNALFATLGPKPPPRSPTTPTRASAFRGSTNGNKSPADIFSQPHAQQSQVPGVGSIVEMGSGILNKGLQSFKSFF